jgi:hypothetical protein
LKEAVGFSEKIKQIKKNMDTIQAIKQRFEIIGNEPKLNRAI